MNKENLYLHHVGGRGGTVSFPNIKNFPDQIHSVIYDADPDCIDEIKKYMAKGDLILPYCLTDQKRIEKLKINFCPFTSSIYNFNRDYDDFYEEKRLNNSDYIFKNTFTCIREVELSCETLDNLYIEKKIPQVDFLSIDTQGAELLILKGADEMLASTTIGIYLEVNFADLYTGAPLFGELDTFLRSKGFMLFGLWPMQFGHNRISRNVRGLGVPLQGEALYLLRTEKIKNADEFDRMLRLEKLAFCSLVFGHTEMAFKACEVAQSLAVKGSGKIHDFLYSFSQTIKNTSNLPPKWHELDIIKSPQSVPNSHNIPAPRVVRLYKKIISDPKLFWDDLKVYFSNLKIKILIFLNLERYGFSEFEQFLDRNGLEKAAKEVFMRRIK